MRIIKTVPTMHVMHASAQVHQQPPLGGLYSLCIRPTAAAGAFALIRDMHGLNILDDKRSASPLAPAQVAAGGHQIILSEASSASSLSDERRKNIVKMLEIEKTRRGW